MRGEWESQRATAFTMQRAWSVEDFVGGLWRMGSRNDSDQVSPKQAERIDGVILARPAVRDVPSRPVHSSKACVHPIFVLVFPSFSDLKHLLPSFLRARYVARFFFSALPLSLGGPPQSLQDYLRRVPSGTWTGGAGGTGGSGGAGAPSPLAQFQQQAAQQAAAAVQQQAQAALAAQNANAPLQALGGGMPRVASLDMLRALVMQQSPQAQAQPHAPQAVQVSPPQETLQQQQQRYQQQRQQQQLQASPGGLPPGLVKKGKAKAKVGKAATGVVKKKAAASLPKRGSGGSKSSSKLGGGGGGGGGGGAPVEQKQIDKVEIRRVRRMLSNRESARRSRRRKQEHLATLEERMKESEDGRSELETQIEELLGSNKSLEEENRRLREQLTQYGVHIDSSNGNGNGAGGAVHANPTPATPSSSAGWSAYKPPAKLTEPPTTTTTTTPDQGQGQ